MREVCAVSRWLGCLVLCGLSACSDRPVDYIARPAASRSSDAKLNSPATVNERRFKIAYEVTVTDVPVGEQLNLWIPVPQDDATQEIGPISVTPLRPELLARYTRETRHGNRLLYVEWRSDGSPLTLTLNYDVERREERHPLARYESETAAPTELAPVLKLYLQPTSLVIVDERIRTIARQLVAGRTTTVQRARAFYDHVQNEMRYDKPTDLPWGRGDTRFACDAKLGNCTDFHSYFMSLCLAENIPVRFQIGLYNDSSAKPGEVLVTGSYHCWAHFYVPGHGWVPVDISEADRLGDRGGDRSSYFGAIGANRVTLSNGRDLVLEPAQHGPPINFMVDPYAEVAGQPIAVTRRSRWQDIE